jgi:hypothetical protein
MDAEIKAKWVQALRSGEFKQGVAKLHDPQDNTFCCLGVLCKVMGAEFGDALDYDDEQISASHCAHVPHIGDRVLSSGEDQELKASVCKELGIPDQAILIQMNDGHQPHHNEPEIPRRSFAEIADYIEQNL